MSNEREGVVTRDEGQGQVLEPELRFPEFRKAGAWKLKTIGRSSVSFSGATPPSTQKEFYGGQVPFIRSAEIGEDRTELTLSPKGLSKSAAKMVSAGDVLLAMYGANSGNVAISKIDGAINQAVLCLRHETNNRFLFHFLTSRKAWIKRTYLQGGQGNISGDIVKSIPIPTPLAAEQLKIADCLCSLDAVIAAERDRLAALKAHKKGLMQQLFPALGQTTPRLRFPEFQGAGEWEATTIGDVGTFYYGKSAPKWSLEEDAPTPCVRYGELYTKYGPVITETFSRTNILPENLKFSKGGEILVPRVGEKPDDFGRNCSLLTLSGVAIGEMISVFETDQNAQFYTFYFRHIYRAFAKVVEGQNVKNLYFTELEPLPICRPSVQEQEKIADCLLSLERTAAHAEARLAQLAIHKTALMQQLFPSPHEATA